MKILVIGSGLIGLTTAYYLRCSGYDVTVVDRAEGPGRETSYANGALLTPSMPEPWNAPGCWRLLLASLGRSDAALQLRLRALPSLAIWGVEFLRNSRADRFTHNTLHNLRLALYSLRELNTLRQSAGLEFGHKTRGTLRLFRSESALERAANTALQWSSEGLVFQRLSTTETVKREPALSPVSDQLAGALHYIDDEAGDAYRFCVALADAAQRQGVRFHYGVEVSRLKMNGDRVVSVVSNQGEFTADQYIVAAGSHSTALLAQAGVRLPVRPAKGYSVTIDDISREGSLGIPILDDDWHAAIVPLSGAMRIAGTAEFAGNDRTMDPARIANLLRLLRQVLPQLQFDSGTMKPWCGLRPMSADGVPIIGRTRVENLFVNTGHGPLGWTMSAGSAKLLADMLTGDQPSLDPSPYSLSRY